MLKRILIGALALVLAAAIAGAGWYYQPWSPYSPASIRAMDNPDAYPQTFQRLDSILPSRPIAAAAPEPLPRAVAPLGCPTSGWARRRPSKLTSKRRTSSA